MMGYFFVMDGEDVAATFDGTGNLPDRLKSIYENEGYKVVEVDEKAYRKEQK